MLKFAVLNDLHLADNPPLGRRSGYIDQLFAKLVGVATTMQEQHASMLVLTGDVFHVKRPDRVSHALVNRIVDTLKGDFDCDIVICPGNHDLSEAGIDSLPKQPLGSLFQTEVAAPLIKNDGWVNKRDGKTSVLFLGRHYDTDGDLDPAYYLVTAEEAKVIKRCDANVIIMVAHGSIVPPDGNPIYPHVVASAIPWEEGAVIPDLLLCGHLHEEWGIHKVYAGPIYANLGSFGRPSRNQLDVNNRDFLMVTVGNDLKITLERFPIPHMLPAAEVFLEKVEEHEDEALAEFAEQLASAIMLEETSLDDALAALGEIKPNVKARLKQYLEEAGV